MDCVCIEYGARYSKLTKELLDTKPDIYYRALIALRIKELERHSGYIKKIDKAKKNGTKIKFSVASSKEEALKAIEDINKSIKEVNSKFNKKISTISLVED
ncbi:hypothetical protein HMPREF1092_00900 [Clostridium thermobutyricum]|uniref:Uncharacterized protein n=1 Tax=Clostridium thermobutyricum TaxID=29372 RepID=N9WF50_9CLOT|nr:hypothetical protein [Clostridium thermobutyricum]ENZ01666.1 hypothetical protein HMPREF1092_00900 [Clostridium thermobutyricum]